MSINPPNSLLYKKILLVFIGFCFIGVFVGNSKDKPFVVEETILYNSNAIFTTYANEGFKAVVNDLYEYYEDIFYHLPDSAKKEELRKMRHIAEILQSQDLKEEADLLEIHCLTENNEEQIIYKAERFNELARESAKKGNSLIEMRSMEAVYDLYWRSMKYAKAFHQVHLLEKWLQDVSGDACLCEGQIYFRIGEAYYFFRDYDKAIPYLRKAIGASSTLL